MPNDPSIAAVVLPLLATYLLHSTLLLGGVWITVALARSHSATLHDRLWKLAALAPLLTAPLQLATADHFADWSVWTMPAVAFPRVGAAPAGPLIAMHSVEELLPPQAGNTRNRVAIREGEAPSEPLGSDTRHPGSSVTWESTPVEPSFADDGATVLAAPLVEIIPAPSSPCDDFDERLPIIEPAESVADASPNVDEFAPAPVADPGVAIAQTDDGQAATVIEPDRSQQRWAFIAVAIVALAALRLAWRSLVSIVWRRRLQTIAAGPLRDTLNQLLRSQDVRRSVRLATSPAAREPAAGGVLRWTIVVPAGLEHELSTAEQHALLAHELAHLVRRDPLWLWIGSALCWCLPFQPLNFLAARRWRQAAEELCDDWAIATGIRPLTLANCLTRVAELRFAPMPLGLTSDVGKSRFARRIARLVTGESPTDRWSRPWRRRLLLATTMASAAVLISCGPRMQAAAPRDAEAPETKSETIVLTTSDSSSTPNESLSPRGGEGGRRPGEGPQATTDIQSDLAALLADLERVEQLIGQLGNDPELTAARDNLRARLQSLRTNLQ